MTLLSGYLHGYSAVPVVAKHKHRVIDSSCKRVACCGGGGVVWCDARHSRRASEQSGARLASGTSGNNERALTLRRAGGRGAR